MAKCFCEKCNRELEDKMFYTYKGGQKTEMCKRCLTMHVDAFDETTFVWILEKMDLPYIPEEWNILRDKDYKEKGAIKFKSDAVFGKYLSKMKLNQWNKYGWADGPRLIAERAELAKKREEESKEKDAFYLEKFQNGEISEAEFRTLTSTTAQRAKDAEAAASGDVYLGHDNPYNENLFIDESELPDLAASLTQDDKIRLAMKWGRLYKPDEWIDLETHYEDMTKAFDIQDPDSRSTLILICKTDLKMNQCLDNGDIEGFQKLSKVSEGLRKSAKFTAAQNKEDKGDFVDSIGQLVSICEQDGFIPRYATDIPQDKVDLTLKDMKDYLHKLVTQDLGFGQQIEDSLKKIMLQKEMNEAASSIEEEMHDEDFQAFYDEKERQMQHDEDLLNEDEWIDEEE